MSFVKNVIELNKKNIIFKTKQS